MPHRPARRRRHIPSRGRDASWKGPDVTPPATPLAPFGAGPFSRKLARVGINTDMGTCAACAMFSREIEPSAFEWPGAIGVQRRRIIRLFASASFMRRAGQSLTYSVTMK